MTGDADVAAVAALIGEPARAAVLDALLDRGWVERRPADRGLRVTPTGRQELALLAVEA